ncbi:hypothetical protein Q4Q35_04230 [Flavivirga aquimarina]|uniref:SnoaL-like domain-containing protein n=1 Tax=Flavivirga aquimarina TaxID=2027862 RepID=A0ABT8W7G6_9FLAO|nr:hypothetical protein [Flavivirga aquimarina]MDO5969007.1 hypothetical protein [Flavivirga aquimarina]
MKLIWTTSLLLTVIFNSYSQKPLSSESKDAISLEIKQMFNNYHSDITKKGLTSEFKYLDASSDFFWVPPGHEKALDYDTIKSMLIANSKIINFIEFSWESIKIIPLTKKIANYTGIVKCVQVDANANAVTFKLIESGTLIKRKDGWKFLNGQSRNLPQTKMTVN